MSQEFGTCKCNRAIEDDGYRSCRKCRERAKVQSQRHRDRLREAGLCQACGKNQPKPGLRTCQQCIDNVGGTEASRNRKATERGMCNICLVAPARPGRKSCQACVDKAVESNKKRTQARFRCNQCGGELDRERGSCDACRARRKTRRSEAIERGLCGICTLKPIFHANHCEECLKRTVTFNATRSSKNIEALFEKLELQQHQCALSGRRLVFGENASVDHIIPRALGGSDELDNLQWTDWKINEAKRDMTVEEFRDLCRAVVQHVERDDLK